MQPVDIEPILGPAIFALGLCFGSFLNVCIYRLPRAQSVVTPRSACPHCGDLIPLYHNVPVLSWLILGGKCRACKQPISPRYLVIEFLTGLLFLGCYAHFGPTIAMLKCTVLGYLLLGLIFTDAETKLLPDAMTLPGLALGILFSLVVPVNDLASHIIPGMVSTALRSEISWRVWSLSDSLLGAAVGASFLYGAAAIYLRARGVEDLLIASIDGLKGFPEAIAEVFPKTEIQLCIVHQIRNSLKYVVSKDQKTFMADLKLVYRASSLDLAEHHLLELGEKWGKKYPAVMKSWNDNWENLSQYFKYPEELRRIIYTTNIVEGFHRQIRKYTKNKGAFTSENALLKLIYCACQKVLEKWNQPMHNWALIISQLQIYFDGRLNLGLR